jgi:hypothetical protein
MTDPLFDTEAILRWSDAVGLFALMNSRWAWPICESLHFIGLSLLLGTVGVFDLRMLGLAKNLDIAALHRLIPFGVAGFVLNLVTGAMFFLAAPAQYLYNPSFQTKLAFMALAGLNMAVFYLTVARPALATGPGAAVPLAARVVAAVSLLSWLGVIAGGRLITFFRPPYFWCAWC